MTPEQRTRWLEWRRSGLGGSDVAAVIGLSPWSTPWQVWRSKVEPVRPQEDRPELATGRLLEGAVIAWTRADAGGEFLAPPEHVEGPERWMLASPDAMMRVGLDLEGIEAKTSRDAPWDAVPIYYETQCRWYMAITGLKRWHLGCFFKRHDAWRRWVIDYDGAIEGKLIEQCGAWWDRHVIGGEPPPVDASDACRRWQHEQHADPSEEWRDGGAHIGRLVATYAALGEEAKRIGLERDTVAATIREAIGDAQGIRGGAPGCSYRAKWSRWTTRRIDTRQLREDHPDLAERYTTETPTGRLTVNIEED